MRCINIDWLECYCLEPIEGRDADYFRSLLFQVNEREYGTRHMEQVFTICDKYGDPFMEIRRKPRSKTGKHSIYPENACNLRLVNRYCYFNNAAEIMADFIYAHGYEFRRIFRIDLAMDFEKFDLGDMPKDVMRRIVKHTYVKVYQANRTVQGYDRWDESNDNYIRWGNPKSMVTTAFYNKTKELKDSGMKKPWIVQSWFEAGLIDNPINLTKKDAEGHECTPEIWRVEFRISSSARKWVKIDSDQGDESVEHTLDTYLNRDRLIIPYAMLAKHYFNFRIFKKDVRKYDCPQKVLFDFALDEDTYKLTNTATHREYVPSGQRFIKQLLQMRESIINPDVIKAIDTVIEFYEQQELNDYKYNGISPKLLQLMFTLQEKNISIDELKEISKDLF